MLGVGLLGVANGFTNTGFVTSIVLLILMAGLSLVSTWMIVIRAHQTESDEFPMLADRLLGPIGAISLSVCNLTLLTCAEVAYLILGGDMLISWFSFAGVSIQGMAKRIPIVGVYSLCLPVALTIPRDINLLKKVSMGTVIAVLFFAFVMVYEAFAFVGSTGIAPNAVVNKIDMDIFSTIAMFGLSFTLPCTVMSQIRTYNPQINKRKNLTAITMTIVLLLVLISGVCGYMIFGADAQANILNSFRDDDKLIVITRAGFFVVVTCAYPGVMKEIIIEWSRLFFGNVKANELPGKKRAIALTVSNIIPVAIAMFIPDAKPVLEVGGGIGGCSVNFVFPALFWIMKSEHSLTHYQNLFAIALAGFGVGSGIISTYLAVIGAIKAYT
jgi:amino acid permease